MHSPSVSVGPVGASASRERFLVLPIVILILAQMGTTGDNGALSLAASALTTDLGATTSDIQLANMIYPLVGGAFMIAGGLLGTIFGWARTFRTGALVCALGEAVLAFSPNMVVFIWVGRVLVGLGASLLVPSVLGMIPLLYQGHNRMVAFGCIGAASGLSAVLPLILGVVMEAAGMRPTFLVLGAYFFVVAALSLRLPHTANTREKLPFDGVGVALAALGLFLVLVGLSSISSWGLVEPFEGCPFTVFGISPALPAVACGIVVLVVLVRVERGVEEKNGIALLPSSFLKTPQVLAGLTANALMFFFMGAQSILMAPYLQLVAGWSPIDVGTISIVTGIPTFALSLGIPKLAPHANPRHVIQAGYVAMALALGVMALSVTLDGANTAGVYLGAFLAGVGAGTVASHASNVVAAALPERDASQSGGIQSTMRNVGQAVGVALLGAVLLFGITNTVRSGVAADLSLSPEVHEAVSSMSVNLGSNEEFEQQIKDIPMSSADREKLVKIDAQARFDSTRVAYAVGGVIVLLGLATTPLITTFEKGGHAAA
ncbi:MFS transporter [Olsenella sp. An285]|uniref:MFS transporter n=1 Tax=Olsenella sp. An285 TaxID=1965621 RepID=UPI000B36D82B|nr:MFS transporter [Olsenella sp. An285]OUO47045.1 MFS transporter [Olsenella sp. An285]